MVLTESAALAKEIAAEFAAAAEQAPAPQPEAAAPAPVAIEEPAPAAIAEPAPQPEGKPLSFRERWLAKVGQLAR